jgi:hypothetical protein
MHSCIEGKSRNQNNCKSTREVSEIRYLSVIFDKNLKWDLNIIYNLVGKLRSKMYTFT